MLRAQDIPPDPYGTEQLSRLIVEPRRGDTFVTWRTWAIILWILDTGNCASTVCNVRMGDLYGQQVRLTHTKNKKAQIITLGTLMVPVLEKYIRKFRADATADDYLFPSMYNEKLTVNALQESIKDYNHARGVNKTGVHDLRKTYTTMALASGKTTEQEVADRLGHGNTSLLKKYAQFSQAQKLRFHDASSPLNELIAPKKPRIRGR
jgi:integrase/recombinase XerD